MNVSRRRVVSNSLLFAVEVCLGFSSKVSGCYSVLFHVSQLLPVGFTQ